MADILVVELVFLVPARAGRIADMKSQRRAFDAQIDDFAAKSDRCCLFGDEFAARNAPP